MGLVRYCEWARNIKIWRGNEKIWRSDNIGKFSYVMNEEK